MHTKAVGDRIEVNADEALGTPAAMGTIVSLHKHGYMVHIDGDDPAWYGPVTFNGDIIHMM